MNQKITYSDNPKVQNQIEKIDTIYTKAACKRVFNYKLKKLKPAVD